MRTLPPELSSWEPYLKFLDPVLAPALGRMADQVLRALAPVGVKRPHQGEPSGWSGLSRRGPMERLLQSDWALAEVAPEEFLRRASQNELLFWQREQAASPLGGTTRLLLDCGPFQVGACRLGQLALLVALARRAADCGRRFTWCVGQEPARELEGLTQSGVGFFLKSRSCSPVSDAAVDRFRERAQAEDELWLVGGRDFLERHPGSWLRLELSQTGPDQIQLALETRRHTLALPAPNCVRLLRDPFRQAPGSTMPAQVPGGDFLFSEDGRKLLVRTPGALVVYPIPNTPRDLVGRPRLYPTDPAHVVLAAGSGLTLQAGRGSWSLWKQGREGARGQVEMSWPAPNKPVLALGRCWLEPSQAGSLSDGLAQLLELKDGRLRLSDFPPPSQPRLLLDEFCSLAPRVWAILNEGLYLSHPAHGMVAMGGVAASLGRFVVMDGRVYLPWGGELCPRADLRAPEGRVWLGWGGQDEPLAAVESGGQIRVLGRRPFQRQVPNVQGLIQDPDHWRTPALVSVEGARVLFVFNSWEKSLDFPGEIEKLAFSPTAPRFAYRTTAGELGVYSVPHERILWRVTP